MKQALRLVYAACLASAFAFGACSDDEKENLNCDSAKHLVLNDARTACVCESGYQGDIKSGCKSSSVCGNGRVESGEVCDWAENGAIVYDEGYDSCSAWWSQDHSGSTEWEEGTANNKPGCSTDCSKLEIGQCQPKKLCGNGKIDAGEVCDYTDNTNDADHIVWPNGLQDAQKTCDATYGTYGHEAGYGNVHYFCGAPACGSDCKSYALGTCQTDSSLCK